MTRLASVPFVFKGCVELREAIDAHALDARELAECLERVPSESIFFHVFGYLLRHRPFTSAYGNDFARWASIELGDPALAERLAVVDPFAFGSPDALREELLGIVRAHLRGAVPRPGVERERAFHFQRSHLVEVALGLEAASLKEFRDGLAAADASAVYLHLVEARARLRRPTSDFAEWFRMAIDMPDLATRVDRVDAFLANLERVRGRILALVDEAIEERDP